MSCISVVSHKPTGTMLGIHNDHYTEQLGNTAEGHPSDLPRLQNSV